MNFDGAIRKLQSRRAVIGIVGLGYVGLPLSIAFAESGCSVIGFDVDIAKPNAIAKGHSYLKHIAATRVADAVNANLLSATTLFSRIAETDAILICVPTPLTRHQEPDLGFVEATAREIAKHIRPGQLVVLESTTYPGTTMDVVKPILEDSGLRVGTDIFLAYSPEREDPGNLDFTTAQIPKIVGADDAESRALAKELYELFAKQVVEVSSSSTAEAVKLTENIFRSVNIALVNELKTIYTHMGIDIWEVIEAAKTKPFGYMPFYPGPGLGGHCIPIDPYYLSWKAREFGVATRFIELAGEINSRMPQHVVDVLTNALNVRVGKSLSRARVLVVGLAYKRNVDDTRESPALKLMQLLHQSHAQVDYYDPYVPEIPDTREHSTLAGQKSIQWSRDKLGEYDCTLIATDHDTINYQELVEFSRLVVDTRNRCARTAGDTSNVIQA